MGQYHILYNKTKKEFVHAHALGCGLKLMEQVGFEQSTSTALWLLLANSNGRGGGDAKEHKLIGYWAGDRIVVQGDYAEPNDPSYLSPRVLDCYTDISEEVREMLKHQFGKEIKSW